ncbi:hypothetical protein OPQ81_000431 [Rhizoctonia solani]|nr:hypothetical protein OPQ81_000431 [Rhizoctonia solani]
MSSIEPFRDQKVIVIGGSSGVGRSIATAALAQGASVVIASSSPDKVTAAIKLLREGSKNASGISVKGQAFDIKDSAALTAFLSQEAPFDHLVITAGAMPVGTSLKRPLPGWALTCGPVGALATVTRGLALDLKPIRVNSICMGLIDTELFNAFPREAREALFQSQREVLPVGHIGLPNEVAEAYIFAMKCTYLTGQIITVDGGASLV